MRDYFAELRAKRKSLGICMSCGKHPAPCEPCRTRNREYMRKKRAGLLPEEKTSIWHSKRHYYLKYKYGITEEQYDEMLKAQNYCCAICQSPETKDKKRKRFAIDHCHKTGKVRGLLCSACNKGIGLFEDSVENLRLAIDYLEKQG